MPVDPAQLIEAAMHGAVVIDLPGRTHLELMGQDRASFLHNFCSNHIKGLAVGQGCEAFITSIKGESSSCAGVRRRRSIAGRNRTRAGASTARASRQVHYYRGRPAG